MYAKSTLHCYAHNICKQENLKNADYLHMHLKKIKTFADFQKRVPLNFYKRFFKNPDSQLHKLDTRYLFGINFVADCRLNMVLQTFENRPAKTFIQISK